MKQLNVSICIQSYLKYSKFDYLLNNPKTLYLSRYNVIKLNHIF